MLYQYHKVKSSDKILLTEKDDIISSDIEVADCLNSFFSNIVSSLKIPKYTPLNSTSCDPILKAIDNYNMHPSILKIRERSKNNQSFSFETLERADVLKEILKLNSTKACQESDIPTRVIKENSEIFADFLLSPLNNTIKEGHFPDILKLADVTPIFKKGSKNLKENYRPISILPNISKIFERPLFDQITIYFDQFLSPLSVWFSKRI